MFLLCRFETMGMNLNDLPDEVLLHIFLYLDQLELYLSLSWVCKRWHNLAFDRKLWIAFDESKFYGSPYNKIIFSNATTINILKKTHTYLKSIEISAFESILIEHGFTFPNLKEMVIRSHLPVDYFESVIQTISLPNTACVYYGDILVKSPTSIYITMLDELGIGSLDPVQKPTRNWDVIEHRIQSNINRETVALSCDCRSVPKKIFEKLAEMPKLRELQIVNGCIEDILQISQEVVSLIFNKILVLHLSPKYSTNNSISHILSNLQQVRCLTLTAVPALCLGVIENCSNLVELAISETSEPVNETPLSDIVKHCTKLKRISLDGVQCALTKCMKRLCHSANLQHLRINSCTDTDCEPCLEIVHEILRKCGNLKELIVTGISSIHFYSKKHKFKPDDPNFTISNEEINDTTFMSEIRSLTIENNYVFNSATLESLVTLNLKFITVLRLSQVWPVKLEALRYFTTSCCNVRHFRFEEDMHNQEFIVDMNEEEKMRRACGVLDNVCCTTLETLDLSFCCDPILMDYIIKLMKRNPYLGCITMFPVIRTEMEEVPNKISKYLGKIPNRDLSVITSSTTAVVSVEMLPDSMWKLINTPQWGNVWRKMV